MYNTGNIAKAGSSLRYSQLSSMNNDASSPSTPSGYISSSLNPTKNTPFTSNTVSSQYSASSNGDVFEDMPIIRDVNGLGQSLDSLSTQISSFNDQNLGHTTDEIIRYNDNKTDKIENLKKHAELGERIRELENYVTSLDRTSKNILKELMSCHKELKKLPRLPSRDVTPFIGNAENEKNVQDVLKYAMKLSRFTKIPSSSTSAMVSVHPNNFIWPAEDSLRRGMLAMSSLKENEIINQELGYPIDAKSGEPEKKNKSNREVDKESPIANEEGRSNDKTSYESIDNSPKNDLEGENNGQAVLNLDLFNHDEDDFSD